MARQWTSLWTTSWTRWGPFPPRTVSPPEICDPPLPAWLTIHWMQMSWCFSFPSPTNIYSTRKGVPSCHIPPVGSVHLTMFSMEFLFFLSGGESEYRSIALIRSVWSIFSTIRMPKWRTSITTIASKTCSGISLNGLMRCNAFCRCVILRSASILDWK